MKQMTIQSSAFAHMQTVPRKYTGDGDDKSPPLSWSNAPAGTKEFALIVDDPDAPTPEPWVHWVIYRIPPEVTALPEGVPPSLHVDAPAGAVQGTNSWPKLGYGGPLPPKGHGLHHYHFKVYALDLKLSLEAGQTKKALLEAMANHIIAQGELIGTYQR